MTALTPFALRMVERFDADEVRIAAHLARENRGHAVGHGWRDPASSAAAMVAAVENASDADIDRCRRAWADIRRELGRMSAADWTAGTCDVCGCSALVLVESTAFVSWTSCAACIDREPAAARAPASAPQERMFDFPTGIRGQLEL